MFASLAERKMEHSFLADVVLITHFLYAFFVVGGLLFIWIGGLMKWQWVKLFWFRVIHLASIAFVAIISLFGIPCPLTILEANLRIAGGADFYNQSFIQYWLHKILFYEVPEEIFTAIYVVFAIAVTGSFYFVPVHLPTFLIQKNTKNRN